MNKAKEDGFLHMGLRSLHKLCHKMTLLIRDLHARKRNARGLLTLSRPIGHLMPSKISFFEIFQGDLKIDSSKRKIIDLFPENIEGSTKSEKQKLVWAGMG